MEDDLKPGPQPYMLNADLDDLSISDIDECIAMLEAEIARLKSERTRKQASVAAADAFFKS